jgi:hypothetical protein
MTRRGRLNQEWTQAEMDALRAGARIIPGRTPEAVRTMRHRFKVVVGSERAYTAAEVEALKAGARSLPGRSHGSVFDKRKRLGLTGQRAPLWTPEENALLTAGSLSIPGRTYNATVVRRHERGIKVGGRWELIQKNRELKALWAKPWVRQPDPNRDLFQHLFSLVRTTNADLRREIASEAALLLLEENLPPEVAVTEAAAKVRRFYGRENWHTEISKIPFL